MYNAEIIFSEPYIRRKSLALIAHLLSWLKTMCSLLESKSVNAVLGTQTQKVENWLATAASIIVEHFDLQWFAA